MNIFQSTVAPYAGAWIEILKVKLVNLEEKVAPYAGAWIEIGNVAKCAPR